MWNVFSIESEFFRFELEIWFIEMSFSVWGDGKWAWKRDGERENPRRGRRYRKASGKTHPGNFKRISEWILYIHSDVHI